MILLQYNVLMVVKILATLGDPWKQGSVCTYSVQGMSGDKSVCYKTIKQSYTPTKKDAKKQTNTLTDKQTHLQKKNTLIYKLQIIIFSSCSFFRTFYLFVFCFLFFFGMISRKLRFQATNPETCYYTSCTVRYAFCTDRSHASYMYII